MRELGDARCLVRELGGGPGTSAIAAAALLSLARRFIQFSELVAGVAPV